MPEIGTPTLDQLLVLVAVAEAGSFSATARALNRTQSVVSYTIASLERQLGLPLFDRGQRRPVLTPAGRAVLADARRVAAVMGELRARATGLAGGLEAEVSLAVEIMFPTTRLVAALQAFAVQFPTVALRLQVETLGQVVQLVLDRRCGLGIAGWMAARYHTLERVPLGAAVLVPVAAPAHPLSMLRRKLTPFELSQETQLVLTDRSTLTEGQDFGVLSPRTWRLGDLGAKHALLRAGLGWGNMPEQMVRDDLAGGRLTRLDLPNPAPDTFELSLVHRQDARPGRAGSWLARRLLTGDEPA